MTGTGFFSTSGEAYDLFMGRYAIPLADRFATFAQVSVGTRVLDVGCGPGALTRELSDRLGAGAVSACDPSTSFVAACAARNPGVDVRLGDAAQLPFGDAGFDAVLSQLVLHFVPDPAAAAAEMQRVLRPGGAIATCVWDFGHGMQLLRAFWDAALSLDAGAPDEHRVMRFGRPGEIAQWLTDAGLREVTETTLAVTSTYRDFDELWAGFLAGVGPAGSYCLSLPPSDRDALRAALADRLGNPEGPLTLEAVARAGSGIRR